MFTFMLTVINSSWSLSLAKVMIFDQKKLLMLIIKQIGQIHIKFGPSLLSLQLKLMLETSLLWTSRNTQLYVYNNRTFWSTNQFEIGQNIEQWHHLNLLNIHLIKNKNLCYPILPFLQWLLIRIQQKNSNRGWAIGFNLLTILPSIC